MESEEEEEAWPESRPGIISISKSSEMGRRPVVPLFPIPIPMVLFAAASPASSFTFPFSERGLGDSELELGRRRGVVCSLAAELGDC